MKNKYKASTKSKRLDLRKGGRVKYVRGDKVNNNKYTQAIDGGRKVKPPKEIKKSKGFFNAKILSHKYLW